MYTLQSEKKSGGCAKALVVIGAIMLVGIVFSLFVISAVSSVGSTSISHHVVYKATTSRLKGGNCFDFDATYEMPSGTSQKSGGRCNGSRSVIVDQRTAAPGDFVYLSIQNDEWSARIGCEIYIDEKLVYQTHSEGQYVIASCSGSVPWN